MNNVAKAAEEECWKYAMPISISELAISRLD
jgi:hypothetical protein